MGCFLVWPMICCCSITRCCSVMSDSLWCAWTAALQPSMSFPISQSLLKLRSIESVMPSNQLILCHPLLFLPSIFPSLRVFSNKSALCIRWPEYRAFSLSKHQTKGMLCYVPRCVLNRPAIQGHSVFWNWSTAYTSACPWAQGTHASSPQVQASPSL